MTAEQPTTAGRNFAERRAKLEPDDLRRLGLTDSPMSDFEFRAAVKRDRDWDLKFTRIDGMAGYDRRGLLNVIAALLEARRSGPTAEALTELVSEGLKYLGNDIGAAAFAIALDRAQRVLEAEPASQASALDVERLARALRNLIEGPDWKGQSTIHEYAAEIAAAYAAAEDER